MPPAKKPVTDTADDTETTSDPNSSDTTAAGKVAGRASDPALADRLDGLNLEQALQDFATANARVLDLTRRLCTLTDEAVALRNENVQQQIELERLRRLEPRLDALERSRAMKVAGVVNKFAGVGRGFISGSR